DLGPLERRAFAAAAAAFVGESVGDDVLDAVLPLLRHLRASDRDRLAIALRSLEHAPRLRGGSPLSRLPREDAERVLLRWIDSSIPLLRQAAAALRSLALLAAYGRTDAAGLTGYDGPWLGRVDVPVLPAPGLLAPAPAGNALAPGVTRGRDLAADLELRVQARELGTASW